MSGGRFLKGRDKSGGRHSGVKNKNVAQKEFFRNFVLDMQEEFVAAFGELEAKEKCQVYLKAAEFVLPKISSIKFEGDKVVNGALELLKGRASYD